MGAQIILFHMGQVDQDSRPGYWTLFLCHVLGFSDESQLCLIRCTQNSLCQTPNQTLVESPNASVEFSLIHVSPLDWLDALFYIQLGMRRLGSAN